MAISYGAGPGTVITEYAMDETLGSQTQQTGNNTVVVSDAISTMPPGNGWIGTKYPTYVGRLVIINLAGTQQLRMVTSQVNGTGNTKILTVGADWDTNPVQNDTIHVCYDIDDPETATSPTAQSGGIGLNSRSGLYELTNNLTVGDGSTPSGLQIMVGVGVEADDTGSTLQNYVKNNGYLYMGFVRAGVSLAGGVFTFVNNVDGEPTWRFESGSKGKIVDSLLWGQLKSLFLECQAGSAIEFNATKLLSVSYGSTFFGATITNAAIYGRGSASDLVRVNANTVCNGLRLMSTGGLTTASGSTTTETLTLRDVIFSDNVARLVINSNKTWKMINPTWTATTYSDFSWLTATANYVYDQRSIDVVAQKADGTLLANANVFVYEHTVLKDLVLETYTNGSGVAAGVFTYKLHSTNSSTVTYGGHALRVDCWLYSPYAATQVSTSKFAGAVVLIPDANIVQTTQATALTNGSGIAWNEDGNPSSIIEFASGSGTLAVDATVTGGSSGATGIVTQIVDGDSAAGTVHLKSRNGIAFSGTEGLAASGWSATLVSASEQRFAIWINGITKSLQTIYDYLAAVTADTAMGGSCEVIHEWGRDAQARALYLGTAGFYTERSYTKGVFIVNYGSGAVEYFTDDAGVTWAPPASITLKMTVTNAAGNPIQGVYAYIDDNDQSPYLMNTTTDEFGVASAGYTGAPLSGTRWRARLYGYKPFKQLVDIGAADITLFVTLVSDPQQT